MLRTRVITALVLVAVLLAVTLWSSPFQFAVFVSVVLALGVLEWTRLMGLTNPVQRGGYMLLVLAGMAGLAVAMGLQPSALALERSVVLAVTGGGVLFWCMAAFLVMSFPATQALWSTGPRTALMGLFTLLPVWCALIQLKYLNNAGYLVLAVIALVSIADIGAYFVGRAWGRSKLAPLVSPGKSWAGFWGGMCASALLACLLLIPVNTLVEPLNPLAVTLLLLTAVVVAVFSVFGDLFESMLKRSQGMKDSGNLLPGHGGVLDRIDSLTAAAPVFVFLLLLAFGEWHWQ